MTSLFSNTMSPDKDGNSSLPRRSSNLGKPPLRALYDLLIAPMEGVSPAFMVHCLSGKSVMVARDKNEMHWK